MALAYRSGSFVSAGNGSGGDLTLTKPTGTVDGDRLIIGVYFEPDTCNISISPGIWEAVQIANTGAFKIRYFTKIAASEPASYTISNDVAGNQWRAAIGAAYSGGSGSGTLIDVSGTNQGDGVGSASQTAPSVTTGGTNRMLLFGYGNFSGNNIATLQGTATNLRGAFGGLALGDVLRASAGATGTTAPSTGVGTETFAALHMALISDLGGGAATYTGTVARSLPALTASASGTFVAPVYAGSAAISLPALDADAAGAFDAPVYTGTAAISLPVVDADGSGIFDEGVFTGAGALSLPALDAAASGAFAVPVYTGQAALSLASLSLAGAGAFDVPVYTGQAAPVLPALDVDGSGDFASAIYAGDGDFSLPALGASATGAFAEFVFRALKSALHNAIGIRF